MAIFEAILAALVGLFKSIPIFDRWFSKSPTQKLEDEKKDLDEKETKLKETGRPEW